MVQARARRAGREARAGAGAAGGGPRLIGVIREAHRGRVDHLEPLDQRRRLGEAGREVGEEAQPPVQHTRAEDLGRLPVQLLEDRVVEEVDHESHLLVDAHPQLGRQVRRVAQGDEAIICGTFAQT